MFQPRMDADERGWLLTSVPLVCEPGFPSLSVRARDGRWLRPRPKRRDLCASIACIRLGRPVRFTVRTGKVPPLELQGWFMRRVGRASLSASKKVSERRVCQSLVSGKTQNVKQSVVSRFLERKLLTFDIPRGISIFNIYKGECRKKESEQKFVVPPSGGVAPPKGGTTN